jgi:hypothetical protein
MRRFTVALIVGVFVFLAAGVPFNGPYAQNAPVSKNVPNNQFEVLNPWAEVDPKPPRGIQPRLNTLAGKKIGMFANTKRAAKPILAEFEKNLKQRYPDAQTSLFQIKQRIVHEAERPKFEAWVKGVDAVVAAVGD